MRNAITSHPLVRHWRKLTGKTWLNGKGVYVHPDDLKVLGDHPGCFNLDYPPPAYVGDIVGAPVIMLLTNGGYSDGTKNEFENQGDAERYLDCLHDPRLMSPKVYSPYYLTRNYKELLKKGELAVVNVAAYRSPNFSPARQKIADDLESVKLHRRWLREILLPEAAEGKCFVVAHRYTHWELKPEKDQQHNLYFSRSQRSPHMELDAKEQVCKFLASR